jgi:predicted AlkP superfamily pyrophosphatase or phosphodiesterase
MPNVLVVSIPGVSPALLERATDCQCLQSLADAGVQMSLKPCFPAVTCSVQASILTGTVPANHGIVGNGWFQRDFGKVSFWEQSSALVSSLKIWEKIRVVKPMAKTGALFWQNIMWSEAQLVMTPAPIHAESGMVPSCYARPMGMYEELAEQIGEFNLHHYWGPMASIASSEWITKATLRVMELYKPLILFTYLPQMDYTLQRFGPNSPAALTDLKKVDALLDQLKSLCSSMGYTIVVLSEYGMSQVDSPVEINRVLRQNGFLQVREVKGKEYLDYGASDAFAVADHQVAHIYCKKPVVKNVKDLLASEQGIERVMDEDSKRAMYINHPRSGDLVAYSHWDKWFSYEWWEDEKMAPEFASTVDIHRKPGYDPLELFLDPQNRTIGRDHSLVKGSHGRPCDEPNELGILLTDGKGVSTDGQIAASQVMSLLLNLIKG